MSNNRPKDATRLIQIFGVLSFICVAVMPLMYLAILEVFVLTESEYRSFIVTVHNSHRYLLIVPGFLMTVIMILTVYDTWRDRHRTKTNMTWVVSCVIVFNALYVIWYWIRAFRVQWRKMRRSAG